MSSPKETSSIVVNYENDPFFILKTAKKWVGIAEMIDLTRVSLPG
jgi:hypothetical protein